MPTYVYKYRRRYGRRWSRYRRYGAYSRYRRRRSGTSSTASSRGRIRVRVPIQQVLSVPVAAGSIDSEIITSSPWLQNTDREAGDPPFAMSSGIVTGLYRAYANLYDQVKCDGVVTRLSILTPIGSSSTPAVQVVIAYDRLGTYQEAMNNTGTSADPESQSTADLFNYSSATVSSAINNSVAKLSRSCWASDIQERTQFHDCTVLAKTSSWLAADKDFTSNTSRVGYFSPLTLIGLRLAAAPSAATTISVLLEQTYYYTFRNPKYGGAAAGVSTQSLVPVAPVMAQRSDTRSLDTEAGMDDDGGLDDEAASAAAPAARVQRTTPISSLFDSSIPVPARYRQ